MDLSPIDKSRQKTDLLVLLQSSGSFILQVLTSGASLVARIFLARVLGIAGFGRFMEVLSWQQMLQNISEIGFNRQLTRSVASYEAAQHWGLLKGLLLRSDQVIYATSLISALFLLLMGTYVISGGGFGPQGFWLSAIFLPIITIGSLRYNTLLGLRYILTAKTILLLRKGPVLWLFFGIGFLFNYYSSPTAALSFEYASILISVLLYAAFCKKYAPSPLERAVPETCTLLWIKGAFPMFMLSTFFVINSKLYVVMVASLLGAENSGVYSVATEWAGIVSYPIIALNASILPHASRLYALGKTAELQRILTKNLRWVTLLSVLLWLAIVLGGRHLLSIFALKSAQGYTIMVILGLGQLFFTSVGPSWFLLYATHQERELINCTFFGIIISAALAIFIIPHWHLEGAAAACATSLFLSSLLGYWRLLRKTAINSSVLARLA